jgi:hypothetical protein
MTEDSLNPLDGILSALFLICLLYVIWISAIFIYEISIKMIRYIFLLLIIIFIFYMMCFIIMKIPLNLEILKVIQKVIEGSTPWKLTKYTNISISTDIFYSKIYDVWNYFK